MEENNNLPLDNGNVEVPVTSVSEDVQPVADGSLEQPVMQNEVPVEITEQPVVVDQTISEQAVAVPNEFSSADTQATASVEPQTVVVPTNPDGTPIAGVGTPLKPKKKINKTLIIVLILVVIFGGVMLMMNRGTDPNYNGNNDEEKEQEIKVNTGTDWGNAYLTYMLKNKKDLDTYEIAFIDVDYDGTPEMFLKYLDKTKVESLKILYIEDGSVYETKYYHDYRIRYIYSLKDQTTEWYLFLTSTKHYGTYTMISKMIDNMAFDSDIKATNDSELIQYGKKYFDTDFEIVFYNIRRDSHEDDYRDFIVKYEGYNKKVEETKEKTESKYEDYEYKEEVVVTKDFVNIAGREYKYGYYTADIPENVEENIPAYTGAIVLNNDGTIIVDGKLFTYEVDEDNGTLELAVGYSVKLDQSNVFVYKSHSYTYIGNQ